MCGIGGFIDWHGTTEDPQGVGRRMLATLAPRGPDGEGVYVAPPVHLVHRRLAVVDPEGGAQPMVAATAAGEVALVYNGELYNVPELRRELEAKGFVARTRSDTEILLLAYLAYGEEVLPRLEGIFAFAVWDGRRARLFAARDRLGVKPLFFAERSDGLVFGSELKTLLAHPWVEPVVDRDGLAEVLALAPARTPGHGVFRGVHELRPGTYFAYDRSGLRVSRYWALESRPHRHDLATTAARVRDLFAGAVTRQLVADVPIGVLLSGGLDSSAVAAFAAAALGREGEALATYAVDFRGAAEHYRETPFQRGRDAPFVARMAQALRSRHRTVELDSGDVAAATEWALAARDLPGMADVDASLLLFCREIRAERKVLLSGEAADEVFGGYPWCHRDDLLFADTFPWAKRLPERLAFLAPEVRASVRPEAYVARRYREALAEVPRLPGEHGRSERLREVAYLNLTRFLPTLLDRKDRMSMAVGLEVRVPFCDHHLVEYVWNIPWDMKNVGGTAKGILREALRGVLPEDVRLRVKSPYPSTHDPVYLERMRLSALERLEDPDGVLGELFDRPKVRALASDEALLGAELPWFGQLLGRAQFFAYLVQIDLWFRRYGVRVRLTP
jgi:asparagine synthase (glutamine-hydrolysing)